VGAEINVTPQFALRGGYMLQTSPMRQALVNNDVEVMPAGAIPHFTTSSKPTNYLTAGFGYRFTPNFFMDVACIYRTNNVNAYAFSNTYSNNAQTEIFAEPAKLTTKNMRIAMTLGYRF
jgi:long-subunit fatty acid transport protein